MLQMQEGEVKSESEVLSLEMRDIGEFRNNKYQVTSELDKRRAYIAFLALVQNRREFLSQTKHKRDSSGYSSDSESRKGTFNMNRKSREIIEQKPKISNA
mmetsp:Transcript_38423/g.36783  ORF Transcript_38423/g.36783 Transcript_38423/m.36783 type:complete len:100 (+) Transcript_38423:541-840(+)